MKINNLPVEKKIMAIGYLSSAVILAVLVTYLSCMKLISNSGDRFSRATQSYVAIDRAAIAFNDVGAELSRLVGKSGSEFRWDSKTMAEPDLTSLLAQSQEWSANPETVAALAQVIDLHKKRLMTIEKEFRILVASDESRAKHFYHSQYRATRDQIGELFDKTRRLAASDTKTFQKRQADTAYLATGLLLAVLCLGLLSVLLFSKKIASMLSHALTQAIAQLKRQSEEVKVAAASISQASQDLAQSATEQASALQQTAASTEETNAMVSRNADNAAKAGVVSNESYEVAIGGKDVVEQMITAIQEISHSNQALIAQLQGTTQRNAEIIGVINDMANRTKVINDIAFQTKLLSFNASVEAARAGEHGKGFAVVAEEVGNLAQLSHNAAKEITQMLDSSTKKVEALALETKNAVESFLSETTAKVNMGMAVAGQCGKSLEAIVGKASNLNVMINDISTATKEQAIGVREITKAMNQLDQVTHRNTTVFQQTAKSSGQLLAQAETLQIIVHKLGAIIRGGKMAGTEKDIVPPKAIPKAEPESNAPPLNVNDPGPNVIPIKGDRLRFTKLSKNKTPHSEDVPSENDPRFNDV
ncbi:MAG: methyl-accepting chemotaxis protein [Deltaproteobacteria bacterium]|nr:methyl-accepting chemotaxis protein [Deltaproteobacteria bacterium]